MRLLGLGAVVFALALVHAPAWAAWTPMALPAAPASLGLAASLVAADSWSARLATFAPWAPGLEPVAFDETRPIPVLLEALYGHLGLPFDAAERQALEAQAAALPPGLATAVGLVLGAVERGTADWAVATAAWTREDWTLLLARGDADAPDAEVERVIAKADLVQVRQAAMRVLAALDAATPLLEQAAAEAGPNSGVLLRDPFDLVLVGGTEDSTYAGNSVPPLVGVNPRGHILIIDLGGRDTYNNAPAAAYPQPAWLCDFGCGRGIPVSVLVDVQGDDTYRPGTGGGGGSMGFGVMGGIGILLDVAGNDMYDAHVIQSTHGMSATGVGLLLDAAGDDTYLSPIGGAMGRGINHGVAALVDLDGDDRYIAETRSQGVASDEGIGVLADLGGDDQFAAGSGSQGRSFRGSAFFLNIGGSDSYDARADSRGWAEPCGLQSGATYCSFAVFLDACGADTYTGTAPGNDGASWQQNDYGRGYDVNEPAALCDLLSDPLR